MLAEKGLGDTSPSSPPPPPPVSCWALHGPTQAGGRWWTLATPCRVGNVEGVPAGAGGAPLTHHYWNLTMCYVLRVETTACYGGDQRQ